MATAQGMQMQATPVPMAVAVPVPTQAVPMQAVPTQSMGSPVEIISLFGRLPGIQSATRSDQHDMDGAFNFLSQAFQQESSLLNPFGIVTATRGSFPIKSTAEGEPTVATLFVACNDRFKGDMSAALVLPDNTVLAQWSRSARPSMIQAGQTDLPLNVYGAAYGQMQTTAWGRHHSHIDASGSGTKVVSKGCFQPRIYYCIGAFCCFFPTCGIAACVFMCMAQKAPGHFLVKRTPDGPAVATLKLWDVVTDISASSKMVLEFPDETDAKTRTQAALAAIFFLADNFIDPPRGGGGPGGDGGGGGGAPDAAVMDR